MSTPENLNDLYTDELKDLWSANDQMQRCLKKIGKKASDPALKELLARSQEGIATHTAVLKELIVANGEKASKEHCKGMEGLVTEATKHCVEEAPKKGPLLDAQLIAQYQRMTHYGVAGFGTAAALAKALGRKDEVRKLKAAVKEMYGSADWSSRLADTATRLAEQDDDAA